MKIIGWGLIVLGSIHILRTVAIAVGGDTVPTPSYVSLLNSVDLVGYVDVLDLGQYGGIVTGGGLVILGWYIK